MHQCWLLMHYCSRNLFSHSFRGIVKQERSCKTQLCFPRQERDNGARKIISPELTTNAPRTLLARAMHLGKELRAAPLMVGPESETANRRAPSALQCLRYVET